MRGAIRYLLARLADLPAPALIVGAALAFAVAVFLALKEIN